MPQNNEALTYGPEGGNPSTSSGRYSDSVGAPSGSGGPPSGAGVPASARIAFWDCETDGLLDKLTRLHCLAVDVDGRLHSCADQPGYVPISAGAEIVAGATIRVAHNGVNFDERAIRKVYPQWSPAEGSAVIDTLILAKLLYAKPGKTAPNNHKLPPKLRFRHSLEAWGMRLGEHKDTAFDGGDWQTWTPEMQAYMDRDIPPLKRLFYFLMSKKPSMEALRTEQDFRSIMDRQEAWGFQFDLDKARALAAELQSIEREMEDKLVRHFGEWWEPSPVKTVKATRKVAMKDFPNITRRRFSAKTGKEGKPYVGPPQCEYEEGAKYTPCERVLFNPKSRDHVRLMLHKMYKWVPKRFTPAGTPQVDDEVLRALPWPEAQILADYYVVLKILGYLVSGQGAWLNLADENGKMHGRVDSLGTYTHRCAHSNPNLGNIPSVKHAADGSVKYGLAGGYGAEARSLFTATNGFTLVGTDAAGIQLRLYAHYISKYDGGEYAKIVAEEDPHAWLRDIVGVDLMGGGDEGRGKGKTVGYARLLGAGDLKIGSIIAPLSKESEQKKIGKLVRERLAERFSAEVSLKADVMAAVQERGYVLSLDGRRVDVLKAHTGLATLLQAGEAVVMKKALILLDTTLRNDFGWRCGVDAAGRVARDLTQVDYEFCANVHDEFQADVRPPLVETYMATANASIVQAGALLKLKCKLKGESKAGKNWMETH